MDYKHTVYIPLDNQKQVVVDKHLVICLIFGFSWYASKNE